MQLSRAAKYADQKGFLTDLFHPDFCERVASSLAFVVAIFIAHENFVVAIFMAYENGVCVCVSSYLKSKYLLAKK